MADHYLYLDETGTLDFEDRPGEQYFGVGSAYFAGDQLVKGLHARNDSARTRAEMYSEIAIQSPRFDATMLLKHRSSDRVRRGGKVQLYKLTCWMHLRRVVMSVAHPGDRIFVIVGHLTTSNRRDAMRHAINDVCQQVGHD